jgi:hypothetical protein
VSYNTRLSTADYVKPQVPSQSDGDVCAEHVLLDQHIFHCCHLQTALLPQVVEGRSMRAMHSGAESAAHRLADAAPMGDVQLMDAVERAAANDTVLMEMLRQVCAEQCSACGMAW